MSKKPPRYWLGHPVRDEEHERDLNLRAAVDQFQNGLTREDAEHKAKHEDRMDRHQKAAAHHLSGLRAANAVGNTEDAKRHHSMYSLHVRALGKDPSGAVPPEVQRHAESSEQSHAYKFRGHPDDQFLVQPVEPKPEKV